MLSVRATGAVLTAILLAPTASAEPADLLDVQELTPPAALRGLAPGDTTEWAAEVTNVGLSPHELTVRFDVDGTDPLATDPRDGLQLIVDLCTSAFTITDRTLPDGRTIQRYLCPDTDIPLGAGPAASLDTLDSTRPLSRGETIGVRVRVSFPASATNDLENTDAALRITVTETVDNPSSGDSPGPGTGPAAKPPGHTGSSAGLAITGRDVGAAILGGLISLGAGALLVVAGRRRRRENQEST